MTLRGLAFSEMHPLIANSEWREAFWLENKSAGSRESRVLEETNGFKHGW
jgi:hypothetical protein